MTENLDSHEHPSDHCKLFFNGRYMKKWNLALIVMICLAIGGLIFYGYKVDTNAQMKQSDKNTEATKENAKGLKEVEIAIKILEQNFNNFESNQERMINQLEVMNRHLGNLLTKENK